MEEVNKLKRLIESNERILITSHISPDPDAISSLLLLGTTLKLNFPDKEVVMVMEEEPAGLTFLTGYSQIEFKDLLEGLETTRPGLVILVDTNNYLRVSRQDGPDIGEYIKSSNTPLAIIDHHEPANKQASEVYLNRNYPAAAQEVHQLLFADMGLTKPEGYAQTTMLGLYSDSGGFKYLRETHAQTFKLAEELVAAGANIEDIDNLTHQYSLDDMAALSELAKNIKQKQDYSFSYLMDGFVDGWLVSGKTGEALHKAVEIFINGFIRNINGKKWGYLVYKNSLYGPDVYSCSFRSVGSAKDVYKIAAQLNGGGHKPAAGGRIIASSLDEALKQVEAAINHSR
jgi:bifunctional oligoribonuclease and PAP phosphatase NrnA